MKESYLWEGDFIMSEYGPQRQGTWQEMKLEKEVEGRM